MPGKWLRQATLFSVGIAILFAGLQWIAHQPDEVGAATAQPLRVGLLEDSPPYDFYDDRNQLVGLNRELIETAASRLGRPVEVIVIPYNRVMTGLLFKHYDVVAAPQSMNPYRSQVVRFIRPYLESGDVIVYHAGAIPVNSLAEVQRRNLRIAAFNGTSYPGFLEKQGLTDQMVVYPTQREMFMAFLNGKVDVMLMDEHIARYYRDQQAFPFALSAGRVRSDKYMAFSVRKESRVLGDELDQVFGAMIEDGTMTAIEAKWLTHSAGDDAPQIPIARQLAEAQ